MVGSSSVEKDWQAKDHALMLLINATLFVEALT